MIHELLLLLFLLLVVGALSFQWYDQVSLSVLTGTKAFQRRLLGRAIGDVWSYLTFLRFKDSKQ